jgi:ribosome biogenesis GTPase A
MTDSVDSLRSWLRRLQSCFEQLDNPANAQRAAKLASLTDENRPIKVVVVGEFNSGKSTLVNALCGMNVLPAGIIPTTATINVIKHSPKSSIAVNYADGTSKDLPFDSDALQQFSAKNGDQGEIREVCISVPNIAPDLILVDTPGVNDINQTRSEIVFGIIPEADAVVFLMDVQQALKRSEVDFLRDRVLGTSIVKTIFVLNHTDRVTTASEIHAAVDYVRIGLKSIYAGIADSFARAGSEQLASELRDAPIPIFTVSAKRMLSATEAGELIDGDPDGLKSALLSLISPNAKLHSMINGIGAQSLGLSVKLRREIDERMRTQGDKRDDTVRKLKKDAETLRQTLKAAQRALIRIESQRSALRVETERAIDVIFTDASTSLAARLSSEGLGKGLQVIQQEIARNLEGRMSALNEQMQKLTLECVQQAAEFIPLTPPGANLGIESTTDSAHRLGDWVGYILNDPVKSQAFWCFASAAPFFFGPIGFVLLALPFVGRLFTGSSNSMSLEQLCNQIANSGEEIKVRVVSAVNDRLNSISAAVLDVFDDVQGSIRTDCKLLIGEGGIPRATLDSLRSEAAALTSALSKAMNSSLAEPSCSPSLLSRVVGRSG